MEFLKVVGMWIGLIIGAVVTALGLVFVFVLSISPLLFILGLAILVFKLIFFGL